MPKCELPCKVYIYCTKGKSLYKSIESNEYLEYYSLEHWDETDIKANGKVVAEFTLSYIECWRPKGLLWSNNIDKTCLTMPQLCNYAETNKHHKEHCYAWRIDDLKIYDTPKDISEFYKQGTYSYDDWLYGYYNGRRGARSNYNSYLNICRLKRPPQSWCYIKGENDERICD